ncbi:unnamed protein product [Mucor hiemalis]
MGQHVGVIQTIRLQETRKGAENDVTQVVVNSNSNSNGLFKQTFFTHVSFEKDKSLSYNVTKGWIRYHLQQKPESISNFVKVTASVTKRTSRLETMNSVYSNPPIQISDDIEQLITMMKNHRVSDDNSTITTSPILNTCDFNFSNGNSSSNKLLTPQHTPPSTTLNSLPEFKFSFPAHNTNHIPLKVNSNSILKLRKPPSEVIEDTETNARINARKILPLPKPRIRKWEENSIHTTTATTTTTTTTNNNIPSSKSNSLVFRSSITTTTTTKEDATSIDRDNSKKKLKCSKDTVVMVDNKRKERNWKDTTVRVEPKAAIITKQPVRVINTPPLHNIIPIKKTEKKLPLPPPPPPPPLPPPSLPKKKGKQLNNNEMNSNNKSSNKKKNNKVKKYEDMAPGGFLSSDVTLFDNPISDDWICLFCQYDILFSGYQETKKKNNRRRKKDINQMTNPRRKKVNDHQSSSSSQHEGSSISSGSSASDDDHVL